MPPFLQKESTIVLYEDEYITLGHEPTNKMIFHIIHQPVPVEIMKKALTIGSDSLKEHGYSKWLSDDRKNGPLSEEGGKWVMSEWQPNTIAAGWKYWAIVVPAEVASAATLMEYIQALHEQGLRMMVFEEPEDAIEWLDGLE